MSLILTPSRGLSCAPDLSVTPPSKGVIGHILYATGLRINIEQKMASGWLKLDESVGTHCDDAGQCMVYCARGAGRLHYQAKEIDLERGQYLIFNDKLPHAFSLLTPSCTLFVGSAEGTPSERALKDVNFIGSFN